MCDFSTKDKLKSWGIGFNLLECCDVKREKRAGIILVLLDFV
jgi:hypothetical protein